MWCYHYIAVRIGAENLLAYAPNEVAMLFLMIFIPVATLWIAASVIWNAVYLRRLGATQMLMIGSSLRSAENMELMAKALSQSSRQSYKSSVMVAVGYLTDTLYDLIARIVVKSELVRKDYRDAMFLRMHNGDKMAFAEAIITARDLPGFKLMLKDKIMKDVSLGKDVHMFCARFIEVRKLLETAAISKSMETAFAESPIGQVFDALQPIADFRGGTESSFQPDDNGIDSESEETIIDWKILKDEPMGSYKK